MRKLCMLIFMMLVAAGMALAQNTGITPPACGPGVVGLCTPAPGALPAGIGSNSLNVALGQDVLGAHNGYGRGCVMCHAPHGGAAGNNAPAGNGVGSGTTNTAAYTADTSNGNNGGPLWGQNLAPYYGATVNFSPKYGGGNYSVTLPANAAAESSGDSGSTTVLVCLSCHDGAVTKPAMMKGTTVEALPIVGGTAPTLFGLTTGNSALSYINEHPVGAAASVSATEWGCSTGGGNTLTQLSGCAALVTFAETDYPASIWYTYAASSATKGYPLAKFSGTTVNGVTCTTCHNQHSMTVYQGGNGTYYPTMFFIKGEYMPSSGGNSVAQFCRNCHGSLSNEMVGLTVPTT